VRERLAAPGTDVVGNSPKEFAEQIRRELEQNGKVIKAVGMKADCRIARTGAQPDKGRRILLPSHPRFLTARCPCQGYVSAGRV